VFCAQDLDNETLLHVDAENRRQTLEEELEFLKQVHEQVNQTTSPSLSVFLCTHCRQTCIRSRLTLLVVKLSAVLCRACSETRSTDLLSKHYLNGGFVA